MIDFVCLFSCSVDKPISDRLVIGAVPITVFRIRKPIAGNLRLVIGIIGVIWVSATFRGTRRVELPPLRDLFGCTDTRRAVSVSRARPNSAGGSVTRDLRDHFRLRLAPTPVVGRDVIEGLLHVEGASPVVQAHEEVLGG